MTTVEEIKIAIQSLSPKDVAYLKQWISELEWDNWDREIEKDSDAGKLDFLIDEALAEKAQKQLREL